MSPHFDLTQFSPEMQLLLLVARSGPAPDRLDALLQRPLDWPRLIKLAHWHGLMPLLYRCLSRREPALLPAPAMARLQADFQANAGRNIALTRELLRVLTLLEQYDIPAIPFKGPVLAVVAYGDLALRQFHDLDILVRPQDGLRAKRLLGAEGYHFTARLNAGLSRHYATSANHHHFAMHRADGRVVIELHWQVAASSFWPAQQTEVLWQRHLHTLLLGKTINTFAPEELVLLLCMHGSRHSWERLGFVVDLAELFRRFIGLDGTALLAEAARSRSQRMLGLGLWLAYNLFEAPLPATLQTWLQADRTAVGLADRLIPRLFGRQRWQPSSLERLAFRLHLFDRRRDRWRYGLSMLTAPTAIEWQRWPLPARLHGLYRLLRPLRLAGKYLSPR